MNDDKPILNYENSGRRRAPWWVWVIVALYAIAISICCYVGNFDIFVSTIGTLTFALMLVLAIIFGIKYGTQDKDYWV